jgi:hypothetical protein
MQFSGVLAAATALHPVRGCLGLQACTVWNDAALAVLWRVTHYDSQSIA